MKILITLLLVVLSIHANAEAPRAYFSADKGRYIVNGKESTGLLWINIPNGFSDNGEAHKLYESYLNKTKWSKSLMFVGSIGLAIGIVDNKGGPFILGLIPYAIGVNMMLNADKKLQKAINIYNGVSADLAGSPTSRGHADRIASQYGLGWKFEF